jgi:flagellar hook-associated protein 1 FlgK
MSGLLATSLSGLMAAQRSMEAVQHNIANVNTEGYSRQSVQLATNVAQRTNAGFIGQGVNVVNVTRSYDQFITKQLSTSLSSFNDVDHFHQLAANVDNIMADPSTGIAPVMKRFFNAVQEVANNPTSVPSRQVLLSEANVLTQGFNTMSSKFEEIRTLNNNDMGTMVDNINTLAKSIADLNVQISSELARSGGLIKPNDLLDKQDALLSKLAEIVNVTVIHQKDGTSSVFIGSGQGLILQGGAAEFTTLPSALDPTKLNIGIKETNGTMDITSQITGGTLAGSLRFRDEVLDPAQQKLGRVAAGLAMDVNALHKQGFDLNGVAGTDLFSFSGTQIPVTQSSSNVGNALVTVNYQDVNVKPSAAANLDFSDFNLKYVSAAGPVNYTLTRIRDNQVINLTANTVGGISTLSFAPLANQPANFKPSEFDMTTTISPGRFTPAISDGKVAVPSELTFGAFTPPVAGLAGQTFNINIDGNPLLVPSVTSALAGDTVTGANLDAALPAFLAAHPLYQQVSGSFATNDLRLRKLDGTAIVPIVASTFSTTAGALPSTVSITGAVAVPAVGTPFTLQVDGLTIYNEAAAAGGTVTASELDAGLNTFLSSGAGLGKYTKTGSFANNDLVLSKLDGTASSLNIFSNFSGTGTPGSFSGSLNGVLASPGGIDIKVDLTGGKTISIGDEFLTRPTYSASQKIGVNIDDPRKIAAATNIEIDPVTKLPVSVLKGPMPSDNRNAAKLANLESNLSMLGGSASFSDAYGQIVSSVGTLTQSSGTIASAQETLLNQAKAAREGLAGVNLDEEAASLVKFQQAYQASAQSIAIVKSLFDTLISAVR